MDYSLVWLLEKLGVAEVVDVLQPELHVTSVAMLKQLCSQGFSEKDCAEVGISTAAREAVLAWYARVTPAQHRSCRIHGLCIRRYSFCSRPVWGDRPVDPLSHLN
jgi:hypothetical protein